ncbi:MAG: hypothetical protein Q4A35_03080 [Candidatus Gracilibacteria bacterium]|nr:hypothetical protein [Candidatus Gracilibacteria bacterium]
MSENTTIQLVDIYSPTTLELREKKKQELHELDIEAKKVLEIEIVDNKTREIIHEQQMKLRNARVEIEKGRKEFTQTLDEQKKAATTIEKELIAIIAETEDALKAKKEAYDAKIKAEKEAEEARKQQAIADRTMRLAKYSVQYDTLAHSPNVMSDDKFDTLIAQLEAEYQEKERIRIEEEKRQAEEKARFEEEQRKFREEQERKQAIENIKGKMMASTSMSELDHFVAYAKNNFSENFAEFELTITTKKSALEVLEAQQKIEEEKRKIEEEKQRAEAERKRIEEEKKREEELKKTREEAEAKAKAEAEAQKIREEQERVEREAREKAEAEARKIKEEAELRARERYKKFLDEIGLTEENKHEFTFIDTDEGRKFYKFVGLYSK